MDIKAGYTLTRIWDATTHKVATICENGDIILYCVEKRKAHRIKQTDLICYSCDFVLQPAQECVLGKDIWGEE